MNMLLPRLCPRRRPFHGPLLLLISIALLFDWILPSASTALEMRSVVMRRTRSPGVVARRMPWQQRQGNTPIIHSSYESLHSSTFLNTLTCRVVDKNSRCRRRCLHGTSSGMVMMPEGPEVRTVVDQLQGAVGKRLVDWTFLSGRYVRNGKPAGWEPFCATMTQMTTSARRDDDNNIVDEDEDEDIDCIQQWNCKGKFIYLILDDGANVPSADNDDDFMRSIWITLGMTGRFVSQAAHDRLSRREQEQARWCLKVASRPTSTNRSAATEEMASTATTSVRKVTHIYYYDTRNFGTLKFCLSRQELADKLQSLGPDILQTQTTTAQTFLQAVQAARPVTNICRFLMDQSRIAGIGNYILAEGLYRAKIDPFCTLGDLTVEQLEALFCELQQVAVESYESQGMTRTTGGQYRTVDGRPGQYAFALQCYGRTVAANGEVVFKEVNGPHGRTIWYTREQLLQPRPTTGVPEQQTFAEAAPTNYRRASSTSETRERTRDKNVATELDMDPVESLTSHLTDPSWKQALSSALESDWFAELARFVAEERASHQIYPPAHQVFEALNLCPLDLVKVVIVGQDPYHGPGQGHGLAFSIQKGIKPPPSLVNIFKEAHADVRIPYPPPHGNLQDWASQGVLLLNSVLTVRRGDANSHARHGWEKLTDAMVEILNDQKQGLVFMLWGQPAQRKALAVDESKHFVIRTSHPSPLGATKTNSPFLGSRCFSKANQFLEQANQNPIDWKVI